MKIAIAYPPIKSDKGVPLLSQNRQFQWFHQPTFIFPVVPAYAATMLKLAGHDVLWLDGIAEQLQAEQFIARLREASPELIVIEAKTPIIKAYWKWVTDLKQLFPGMNIALCGDHVTALPVESLEACPVDYVLTGGDYDFLAVNLAEHIARGAKLEPGIFFRSSGEIGNSGEFACKHDLASQPWIDRDLTKWRLYSEKNGNFRKTPGTYIMSGRDCWHGKCTFCSWTTLYPNYRVRNPEDVVNEIGMLIEKYGIREIMDDTGSFPVGNWLNTFCGLMIERGYHKKVTIDCNMRFGRLKEIDYALMKKAGFRFMLFGLESANQATLDRLVKGLKVEDILAGARAASRAGLDVHVTVMFGYPWETRTEIDNTVRLARELLKHAYAYTLQVTLVVPYPGTPLFKEMQSSGLLTTLDWNEYDMRQNVMKGQVSEDDIKEAIRCVYRGFMQPMAVINKLLHTRHPVDDVKFYWRGFKSLLGHLKDFS